MVTFSTTNGGGGNGALSVRSLVNNRSLPKVKRALLGAAVLKGEVDLKPTAKDVARMVGCSVSYLHAAARLTPVEQQRVRTNLRPLIGLKVKALAAPTDPVKQLTEVVSVLGVGGVLDALSVIEKGAA
jgi:hypothetical protein